MEKFIEGSWRTSSDRFTGLKDFINLSNKAFPSNVGNKNVHYSELYSSWILLMYAAHEASFVGYSESVMRVFSHLNLEPDKLPENIKSHHISRTLLLANEVKNGISHQNQSDVDLESLIMNASTSNWVNNSALMRLDKNAWPDAIEEILGRISFDGSDTSWMNDTYQGSSNTYKGVIKWLVQERNSLAHGNRPDTFEAFDIILDNVDVIADFSRRSKCFLQVALASHFPQLLSAELGDVADMNIGENIIPFETVHNDISVGDHVLLKQRTGKLATSYVKSIKSGDKKLNIAEAGSTKVAICFNRSVKECSIYLAF
ncbi:MAE_28990/MAE_18760 family HEPN-like nuclease [Kocuria rosea]|uniref:MAE_28990/MAE_18760 family HEPN-like nuclease n=1 Tax=Kocuria rosea TaxID=1275 RepID=UPI0011A80270|nr:MAE_28990/MAE_18760 family HEPN-like nuclease [Kocuria rosea]